MAIRLAFSGNEFGRDTGLQGEYWMGSRSHCAYAIAAMSPRPLHMLNPTDVPAHEQTRLGDVFAQDPARFIYLAIMTLTNSS